MNFIGRSLKSFALSRIKPYLASVLEPDSVDLDSLTIDAGVLHLNDIVSLGCASDPPCSALCLKCLVSLAASKHGSPERNWASSSCGRGHCAALEGGGILAGALHVTPAHRTGRLARCVLRTIHHHCWYGFEVYL